MWKNLSNYRDAALLFLRITLGAEYIYVHGWPKLAGGLPKWKAVGAAMKHVGITFWPAFWGFMAAFSETHRRRPADPRALLPPLVPAPRHHHGRRRAQRLPRAGPRPGLARARTLPRLHHAHLPRPRQIQRRPRLNRRIESPRRAAGRKKSLPRMKIPLAASRGRGLNMHSSIAGWSSLVARQAHNLKVVGSNPTPATNSIRGVTSSQPLRLTPPYRVCMTKA